MTATIHTFLRRVALALMGCAAIVAVMLILVRAGRAGCALGGSGCELLSHTRYSLVLGVPLPAFLVGYYCAYAIAYFYTERSTARVRELARFATLFFALVSVIASAWLTTVAKLQFHTLCHNCLIITGTNLVLAVLVMVTLHWRTGETTALALAAAMVGALCLPAGVAAASELLRRDDSTGQAASRAPGVRIHFTPAQVGVVVDPSCEVCAHEWPELKRAFISLEKRHAIGGPDLFLLPAEADCARRGSYPLGHERDGACRVAAHVFCASYQDRTIEYLDLVYEYVRRVQSDFLGRMTLDDYATFEDALGLDRGLQAWCTGDDGRRPWSVDSMPPLTRGAFTALLEAGGHLDVEGTPTLVVGERTVPAGDLDAQDIEQTVIREQERN